MLHSWIGTRESWKDLTDLGDPTAEGEEDKLLDHLHTLRLKCSIFSKANAKKKNACHHEWDPIMSDSLRCN